ncbi:MAG: DNA cytosine methyltransferase [Oscillospiraceae bacterium]|nr:DNA cytosine methyltransferase [Oscillospiraceae bacterium]
MKKQLKIVGNITSYSKENGRVFSDESLAPSLDCQAVHGHSPRIVVDGGGGEMMVKDNNGNHFALRSQNKQLIETIQKNEFKEGEPKVMDLYNRRANEKVSPTLDDPTHNDRRLYDGLRIRRLTPKECWRLMGFSDEDFEKARAVNSDTQLYKQAGNSIVVDVLVAILRNLLTGDREEQEIQRELW